MVPMFAQASDLSVGTIQITGDSNLGFAAGTVEQKGAPEKTKTTDFGLNLTSLYYVTNNIGVGVGTGYTFSGEKVGDVKDSLSALLIGPAVGINYPVAEKAAMFALANVGYITGKSTHEEPGLAKEDNSASGFGFGVAAGAKYFLAKSFSLDGSIGYDWSKLTGEAPPGGGDKPETTISGFGFNVGLSVYFDAAGK
jgi:opacity protein-like surface antigen